MFSKEKFIIGSRGSRLSLAQAEHFKDELLLANPNLRAEQIELKVIKTSGDKFKTENLASMGGKGLFVKEIEEELINKNIDCAVHSLKDVPTHLFDTGQDVCFAQVDLSFHKKMHTRRTRRGSSSAADLFHIRSDDSLCR